MRERELILSETGPDDIRLPFQLLPHGVRGRLVRLGPSADAILSRHDYPDPVARLLGETLALTACLAGALKFDGVFTVQAKGSGAVRTLVADVTSDGALRGYAAYRAEDLEDDAASAEGDPHSAMRLLGGGYIAYTVDQGEHTERYQGIVELQGASLSECTHAYFRQSEQLETGVKLTAGRGADGQWRAAALMIQRMPFEGGTGLGRGVTQEDYDDGWVTAMALMSSCRESELLDVELAPDRLLYRLFHEAEVRASPAQKIVDACSCSPERVERMLAALSADDIAYMKVDGVITVTCEFCKTERRYDDAALAALS